MVYYLGIDVAKAKFDVALLHNNQFRSCTFTNNSAGFEALCKWLGDIDKALIHACIEATGAYHQSLASYLVEQRFNVSVVNPLRIKGFAQSALKRNKTDRTDAKLIAQFCQAIKPDFWNPLSPSVKLLQALVRRLDDLQQLYFQEQNRLEMAHEAIKPSIEKVLQLLASEMAQLQQQVQEHMQQHNELIVKSQLLKTIPGLGDKTIAKILAFCGEVNHFDNAKQLATFAGLNPVHRQSGSSVKGKPRLSKTGSAEIRFALYMPALVAMRHNSVIKAFCARLSERGKPKMLIVGAVMRKLLHIIYGVLKSGKPFDAQLVGH